MRFHLVIDGRSVKRVGRALCSKRALAVAAAVALLIGGGMAIGGTATYTFAPGTIISAGQVNKNFADLFAAVFKIEQEIKNGILEGDQGDPGATGPVGDKGPEGKVGDKGPDGFRGAQGQSGNTGEKGPIGPRGPNALKPLVQLTDCAVKDPACCTGLGGTYVEAGVDKNLDGVLSDANGVVEITSTAFVCKGKDGKPPAVGDKGVAGFQSSGVIVTEYETGVPPSQDGNNPVVAKVSTPIVYSFCYLVQTHMLGAGACAINKLSTGIYELEARHTSYPGDAILSNSVALCRMRCIRFNEPN